MNETITADMIIREVRDKYPGITAVFQAHGLPCAGCHVGSYETIAGGARTHSLNLEEILADLNRFVRDGTVPAPKGRGPAVMAQRGPREQAAVKDIKHIIAIASGKGGVGKSLVTALLAVTLRRQGLRVGILDGDITGPSIPHMFGIPTHSLMQAAGQEKPEPPRSRGGIPIMSMNVLLDDPEKPVVWRGPMISNAIRQFYTDMHWGALDYLLIDLPPGTSDAPMTVMQQLPTDGAVLVSTPQGLAAMVVSKAIHMVQKFDVPIVGVVENMSYITLPDGTEYELFGPSQGQRLVGLSGAPLLGRLPIDPRITELSDTGRIEEYDSEPYRTLAKNIMTRLSQEAPVPSLPVISSRNLAGARSAQTNGQPVGQAASATPAAAGVAGSAPAHSIEERAPAGLPANKQQGTLARIGRFLKQEKA